MTEAENLDSKIENLEARRQRVQRLLNAVSLAYQRLPASQAEEKESLKISGEEKEAELAKLDEQVEQLRRIRSLKITESSWLLSQSGVSLAEKAYLTCNRSEVSQLFLENFAAGVNKCNGIPQVYLVHGGAEQGHDSLIERFRHTWIHSYETGGPDAGIISVKRIKAEQWPSRGDLDERKKLLAISLFESCRRGAGLYLDRHSPAELRNILASPFYANLMPIIQHDIWDWDELTGALIKWYITFWEKVREAGNIPECLIFLNIFNAGLDHKVNEICQFAKREASSPGDVWRCLCVGLKLTCVNEADVLEWMRERKVGGGDDKYRQKRCKKIFRRYAVFRLKCKSMREIEDALKSLRFGAMT
jgi:hypothetical protein